MSLPVRSVVLALILLVLSAATATAADVDTEKLQRELISPWIVTIQGEARARSLQIRGAERKSNDVWTLDATYDWLYTEKPPSVRAELTLASNGYKLELITRANSLIVAESTDLTVFRGNFRPTSGAAKQVTIEKVSAEELSKRRQAAFAQLFVQPGPAVPGTLRERQRRPTADIRGLAPERRRRLGSVVQSPSLPCQEFSHLWRALRGPLRQDRTQCSISGDAACERRRT